MKKVLSLILCLSLALAVVSCRIIGPITGSESATSFNSESYNSSESESSKSDSSGSESSIINSHSSSSTDSSEQATSDDPIITVEVETVLELFNAIAPNRVIQLKPGSYNLNELNSFTLNNQYATIVSFDASIEISNVFNLTIIGLGNEVVNILTNEIDLDVLKFKDSNHVNLSNLRLGHIEDTAGCYGGVISFKDSEYITIERSILFGCGVNGLELRNVKNLDFLHSTIEDCSIHIMSIANSENINFQNSDFVNNRGGVLMCISGCKDVVFDTCNISDNVGTTDIGVFFGIEQGHSAYVSPVEPNGVISNILIKDSSFRRNWTVSESIARTVDGSENSLTFQNVVFEGNSFFNP